MKFSSPVTRSLLGLTLIASSATVVWAQTSPETAATPDMSQRMQDLEKQVTELRAALAAMQAQKAAPVPDAAPATPAVATTAVATPAAAAPAPPAGPTITSLLGPTTLSGFVDVYYGLNFAHPGARGNTLRNFDIETNQFGLNMIELIADKAPDAAASRLGYHVSLGFGQAQNTVNAGEGKDTSGIGQFDQYLKEGYLSYLAPVGKGLQIDVGKFVTPHGAEVIESKDNWNYSRGLLFAYAIPYYHFGARAKYTFNDKYSLTGFFVNGWNNVVDNNSAKTGGLSLGWNPSKKLAIAENYMAGPEQLNNNSNWRQLSDTTVTYTPNAKLGLNFNYDYGHDRVTPLAGPTTSVYWTGIAGYIRYALPHDVAIAGRYEYYNDHYGFTTLTPQHVQEFTGTLERTLYSHLISRFEFRHDVSNQAVFAHGPLTGVDKFQNTVTGGLILTFDTK